MVTNGFSGTNNQRNKATGLKRGKSRRARGIPYSIGLLAPTSAKILGLRSREMREN